MCIRDSANRHIDDKKSNAAIGMGVGLLAGILSLISSAIGLWHSGVELGYFNSPSSCIDTNFNSNITLNDLLAKPISGCDIILWDFLGLSMANWNTILSLFLGCFCIIFGFYNRGRHYEKEKRT